MEEIVFEEKVGFQQYHGETRIGEGHVKVIFEITPTPEDSERKDMENYQPVVEMMACCIAAMQTTGEDNIQVGTTLLIGAIGKVVEHLQAIAQERSKPPFGEN